jgi:hypothetical protein
MNSFWEICLFKFVWRTPLDVEYSEEDTDSLLESFWTHIISLIDYLGQNLYVDNSILEVIAQVVLEDLENLLLPKKLNLVLQDSQVNRIHQIASLLLELMSAYGLSKQAAKKNAWWKRLEYLLSMVVAPTSELGRTLVVTNQNATEDQRKSSPPYMLRDHIIRILKWRKHYKDDSEASRILSNELGSFATIFVN